MTITATDFSISAGGNVRESAGSTIYSILDLHQWLQDLADNSAPSADDNVSILGSNPSELAGKRNASRPMAITLLNGINIDETASHRLNFGSVEQGGGTDQWTGINCIGSGLTSRSHYVVQNNAKYNSGTKWWSAGPIRALFKAKTSSSWITGNTVAGSAQSAGTVTVFSREWGYTFSHFDVDLTPGSEQVAALAVAADANITRLTGNYTASTNTVTSTSPSFTATLTIGDITQSLGGVSKLYKGSISWTGSARLSEVIQALQWACHESANGTINSEAGWKYRKLNSAYTENQAAPFGTFAGGRWFVAQGWWVDTASLHSADLQAYQLISHDGTTVTPPNVISISVAGLVSGDYVLVGKDDGAGDYITSIGLTATGSAAASSVTLSGSAASDVPTGAGYIRIDGNAHTYTGISGTTVSGLSPVVPGGGYSGAAVWFPYVDKVVSGTSVSSGTFNYANDFSTRIRVRNGGASPIVPFENTFTTGSTGGSANAIRNADA